jgi:hypothetical protein
MRSVVLDTDYTDRIGLRIQLRRNNEDSETIPQRGLASLVKRVGFVAIAGLSH